ncbi:ATP-grasp domain-containing protein [Yinghuangia seranimata]|uniref:ATP-grasp domain-containing protein n=1 Tax=Yinghuangia seranimata TaxID=408067 RepID=UPI00248CC062|nr:ATP-grasp domain-containing protein [Yinghuangia seranimata]MDI2124931.1 ATP-grasp domain-containing protein [Yinghuangia seranimata]
MTATAVPRSDRVLVLAPRSTETDRQLATAAYRRGMRVERLTGWTAPAELHGLAAHVYAGPLFADAVAADLEVGFLEAPPGWLAELPYEFVGRRVEASTLAHAWTLRRPVFVKPPNDKSFAAKVYRDGTQLPGPDAADPDTEVLISEAVTFSCEFRLFVVDGEIRAASRYAVAGDLAVAPVEECAEGADALAFGAEVVAAEAGNLPSAIVVDVGLVEGFGWAVVEANAAWASGGYACDPDGVLEVVLRAGGPVAEVAGRDRRFVRPAPSVVR